MKRLSVIGNITQDAEVKDAGARKAINFSIAHNEKYKNQQGEKAEKTTYFTCVIWRESNVEVAKYLTKGTKVLVEGNPEPEGYKDKNGEYKTSIKIIVSDVELLSGLKPQNQETQRTSPAPDKDFGQGSAANGDDLPF
jgi:single-strand DNA-binding protein